MRGIVSSSISMDDKKSETVQIQNTQLQTMPPSVDNTSPTMPSQQNDKQGKSTNRIYIMLAIFFLILILGELEFVFVLHHSLLDILRPSSLVHKQSINSSGNTIPIVPKPTPSNIDANNTTIAVPTGQSADGTGPAAGFAVHVNKVIKNPTVTGDKPATNLEYIEFDVSVTNNTNTTSLTPGVFYLQEATTGKLFIPADMFGLVSYNWIASAFSSKHVTIPGKNPLMTTQIPAGQTVSNLYLIYQILWGEKGQLVWDTTSSLTPVQTVRGPDSPKYIPLNQPVELNFGGKLSVFELHATNNENTRIEVFSIP